ncbi:MAG: LOG family protein [Thermodesulfobacteriota bacterium]|nr:LOG family protein [Thermodesulfobacteriota bacterium]
MKANPLFRGFYESEDGVISDILESDETRITFNATFSIPESLVKQFRANPDHLIFSERSRIARLGVMIRNQPLTESDFSNNTVTVTMHASSVITDYPAFSELKPFFSPGFKIGRLAYCDPGALLSANEVLDAVNAAEMKLPASTSISSAGDILIAPHPAIYTLDQPLDRETLGRILLRKDGKELLRISQTRKKVREIIILPGQGIITTCSMYLNNHYVVLQRDMTRFGELGHHLPATILDPIRTRGINIYLEITNQSDQPIVNPMIPAKIYRAAQIGQDSPSYYPNGQVVRPYSRESLTSLKQRFEAIPPVNCHFLNKPATVLSGDKNGLKKTEIYINGPDTPCQIPVSVCATERRNFKPGSSCPHKYAISRIPFHEMDTPVALAVKYFPNIQEHHDIINAIYSGNVHALYFFEPSHEHGPFLSQQDHNRLQEYFALGVNVYWVSSLTNKLMMYTERDRMGYFVIPEKLPDFHKSMLFAFYGSNKSLSGAAGKRLSALIKELLRFWGKNIGFVTGGGSGVMETANILARENGILSGANYLEITDQAIISDVDFCQIFQASCRHSRQKWFEITSFPIFNVGGLGTLEELGITLCNMKLSILEKVPIVLFDTEASGYWNGVEGQILAMVYGDRAPAWAKDNLVITSDPRGVIEAYRNQLHLF